jgi:hypothetical protein
MHIDLSDSNRLKIQKASMDMNLSSSQIVNMVLDSLEELDLRAVIKFAPKVDPVPPAKRPPPIRKVSNFVTRW